MKLFGFDLGSGNSLKDKLYWLVTQFMTNMGFMLWGGGGGSSAPTQTTVQNTNIPEYAQPYVENMLGATQRQLFNMDSSGEITGFQPYKPYSTNMQDYVAPFSPLQQQAQTGAAALQTPGQFAQATQGLGMGQGMGYGAAAQGLNQAFGYQPAGARP